MSDPIFAIPRHPYASYADEYALIALSGFQQCFIDEIDVASDNTYIVTIYNGEFGDYSSARARIVLWDLEYHMGDNVLSPLPNVELWAADAWYAQQIGAKYAPMGSHPDLRLKSDSAALQRYDVAYLGFIAGLHRREVIREQLLRAGVKVSPMVAWGEERHRILSNSSLYLHVHQHAHIPAVPPLRMVVAAAYGLPVVSETCADLGVFEARVLSTEYERLTECVQLWMSDHLHSQLRDYGEWLHDFLCHNFTFRKSIEAAL